jgi:hypothetical protein
LSARRHRAPVRSAHWASGQRACAAAHGSGWCAGATRVAYVCVCLTDVDVCMCACAHLLVSPLPALRSSTVCVNGGALPHTAKKMGPARHNTHTQD